MKTFRLIASVTVSAYTDVEAETSKEALNIARDRSAVLGNLHGYTSDEHWVVDEVDGEPFDIAVEIINTERKR